MGKKSKSALIVGAGLAGATVARTLADQGIASTVIDQRHHIAGNTYDYMHESGCRIHAYGPHIFHTSDEKVFDFLSRFTQWLPYQHRVHCLTPADQLVNFPLDQRLIEELGTDAVIDIFYRPYTQKMWACSMDALDESVLARAKKKNAAQTGYFTDTYQCMPVHGYTRMVENMLDHVMIDVQLSTPYEHAYEHDHDVVFNSMAIDQYYDYCFGELPYRSIKFHTWEVFAPCLYGVPVINFTQQATSYTRLVEWKYFPNSASSQDRTTLITLEQPCDYRDNARERYYPVKDSLGQNRKLYQQYRSIYRPKQIFIGRCGLYTYLDMHQAVRISMKQAYQWIRQ